MTDVIATTTTDQPAPPAPRPERVEGGEAPRPRRTIVPKARRPRGVNVNDPVGDMLTRIRNAAGARHETVMIPSSRMKIEIARILKAEGFIGGYATEAASERKATKESEVLPAGTQLVVKLKYIGGKTSAVSGIRRISRPGLRVYARKTEMPRVLGGLGISIVSTSAGLMTGREAERKALGGEVLAYVW
jgi:small subunit ribosomal protein S8